LNFNLSNDSIKQENSEYQLSESARNKKEAEDRKKALLLAKMRKIDEQENQLTPRSDVIKATTSSQFNVTSQNSTQLRSSSRSPHNDVVENLHKGIPNFPAKKSPVAEDAMVFGSYSPSVKQPSRRNRINSNQSHNANEDKPLFDLNDNRQNKKNSEKLLHQLFGDGNNNHSNKSSPKPAVVHDSYPWEQNVKVTNKNIGLAGGDTTLKSPAE